MAIPQEFFHYLEDFWLIGADDPTSAASRALAMVGDPNTEEAAQCKELLKQANEACIKEEMFMSDDAVNNREWYESDGTLTKQAWSHTIDAFGSLFSLNKAFFARQRPARGDIDEHNLNVNFPCIQRLYAALDKSSSKFNDTERPIKSLFTNASALCEWVGRNGVYKRMNEAYQIRFVIILLECPFLAEKLEFDILDDLMKFIAKIPSEARQNLNRWYTQMPYTNFARQVHTIQHFVTVQMLEKFSSEVTSHVVPKTVMMIRNSLSTLKIMYEANQGRECYETNLLSTGKISFSDYNNIKSMGSRDPLRGFMIYSEFQNDAVNMYQQLIESDYDEWLQRKTRSTFSFMENSFILDAANKTLLLQKEKKVKQGNVMIQYVLSMRPPYLVIFVRRDHLIEDTLGALSNTENPDELARRLHVRFVGEEGIDEGGVQKEFFQLLIEQLFNPDYGMFEYIEESHLFWPNPNSFETKEQFELIGIVLGLAIFNGVILDVRFPIAIYKKLLRMTPTLVDLFEIKPSVAKSMENILKMSEEDLRGSALTFSVDVNNFGEIQHVPLSESEPMDKEVTPENKVLFVQLYINWFFTHSISTQFEAFAAGFHRCCGGSLLEKFRPEELLCCICGSDELDFEGLEQSTVYQDGYTAESETVIIFWEYVHALALEKKKRLLQFITGSDRVPIKGLASLGIVIGRNAGDVSMLPSAHTCFNYLLLPDYKDKDLLEAKFRIALENAEGFGLR